ncbi:hypothetical protein BJ165DRAFT_1593596 [Panaeolus papilionaceus]|nr:hypothetical protein BJ165DRAFT_1593596 [Panaeolus papilionaceus]
MSQDFYSTLIVDGPIFLESMEEFRCREPKHLDEGPFIKGYMILLVGPTGSGKSSVRTQLPNSQYLKLSCNLFDGSQFIEALSGHQRFGIAKDQLESVTQEPQGYHLVNARWRTGDPIYLIDTPGLSDSKLSEVRVFSTIHSWMIKNRVAAVNNILYFDRITDIRMSGSRWRAISTLLQAVKKFDQESLGISNLAIVHITTMWDILSGRHHQQKAEARFTELRATIGDWHALPNTALYLAKYHNTQTSALDIISFENLILIRDWPEWNVFISHTSQSSLPPCYLGCAAGPQFLSLLFGLLADRIKSSKAQLDTNAHELRASETDDDIELMDVLLQERSNIVLTLKSFERDRLSDGLHALELSDSHNISASISALRFNFNDISLAANSAMFTSTHNYSSEAIVVLPSDICEAFSPDPPMSHSNDNLASVSSEVSTSRVTLDRFQGSPSDNQLVTQEHTYSPKATHPPLSPKLTIRPPCASGKRLRGARKTVVELSSTIIRFVRRLMVRES